VSLEEAREWAESKQLTFMETSALPPGKDIDAMFKHCAKTFHEKYEERLAQLEKAA
jgi:transport family protein 27